MIARPSCASTDPLFNTLRKHSRNSGSAIKCTRSKKFIARSSRWKTAHDEQATGITWQVDPIVSIRKHYRTECSSCLQIHNKFFDVLGSLCDGRYIRPSCGGSVRRDKNHRPKLLARCPFNNLLDSLLYIESEWH